MNISATAMQSQGQLPSLSPPPPPPPPPPAAAQVTVEPRMVIARRPGGGPLSRWPSLSPQIPSVSRVTHDYHKVRVTPSESGRTYTCTDCAVPGAADAAAVAASFAAASSAPAPAAAGPAAPTAVRNLVIKL
jgi:hypothetical protein